MKNMMVFGMSPDEFEALLRKVVQEEAQRQQSTTKVESVSSFKDEILDIIKASDFLQLPMGTIRKKIKCSKHPIPYMKPSRSLLFRKTKLVHWQKEEEQLAREKQAKKHELQKKLGHYLVKSRRKRK